MLGKHRECFESSPILNGKPTTVSQESCNPCNIQDEGQTPCSHSNGLDRNIDTEVDMEAIEQERFSFSKVSNRKKMVLCLCTVANFLIASAYSLLGPFFPLEAEKKGMSPTVTGFVFGLFQLVAFLTSPLMGNFMTRIGIKFMFNSGIFLGGCSAVLFGLLDKCPGGTIFIVMCILIRFTEAFGFAAFVTACMTIVTSEFESHAGSVLGVLKVATGLGNMVGPILAGLLFDIGGFGLPFYCVGCPILLNGIIVYFCLPTSETYTKTHERKTILDLMRSPLLVIAMMSIFVGVSGVTFFLSSLATHLEPFNLSASIVGSMFAIGPAFYAPIALLWGYITDVKDNQSVLIASAHLMSSIAWSLIGPSPFLPFIPYSPVVIGIGFLIVGLTLGCLLIPPIKCMLYGAYELQYEKNADTFAMVSGLYNSVFALGGFCGPFVGSILSQQYGSTNVFTGIGLVNLAMFIVTFAFFSFRYCKRRSTGKNLKD